MAGYTDPAAYWGVSPQTAATFPLGLRTSNNLFNIKYFPGAERNQVKWPGLLGPSPARDQGDPQMLFSNPEDSGVAAAQLLRRKYDAGQRTPQQIIAGQSGWTPGRMDSANAVAGYAGVSPGDDLRLDTPEGMRRFLPALATQEHGTWARDKLFSDDLFDKIAERSTGAQFASGDMPKLDLLNLETGGNAHRWPGGPKAPVAQPMTAPASSPQGSQPMAYQPQSMPQQDESPFNSFLQRFQSPMTQQGLGLLLSAMQGGDLNAGMNAGAQRGQMALQQQMAAQKQRQEEMRRQAIAQMLGDPNAMKGVPEPLVNIARATQDIDPVSQYLVKQSTAGQSDDIKEYEYAVKGGFRGSFQDWMGQKKQHQGEYAKQLVYGTDAAGNIVPMQAGSKGDLVASKMPAGVSLQRDPIKFDAGTHFVLIDPTTRQPIGQIPKNVAEKEAQEKIGQARGQAQVDFPKVKSNAEQIYKYIDAVAGDPNLSNVLGWWAKTPTVMPQSNTTEERIKQLQGKAFLQAFESLKGAGAITEAEGTKAATALARLSNLGQDEKGYREALADFRNEVQLLVKLAEQRARPSAVPQQPGNGSWSMQRVD